MTEPELYFDPDGKPITVTEWSDLRDSLGKNMVLRRHTITDRSAPSWTIFVTTAWLGISPIPGESPPRPFRTGAFQVGHADRPHPIDMPDEEHAWATSAEATAGHADVVNRLSEQRSEPVVSPDPLPPAAFFGKACPKCKRSELREIARPEKMLFAKKPGTYSLPGATMKVSATEAWINRPYCLCSACGFEKAGKWE